MSSRRLLGVLVVVVAIAIAPSAFGTNSVAAAPLTGTVSLVDQSWYCRGPVNLASVTVVIKTAQIDAIHLASGCTGTIGKVTVVQYHGDGIIVGPGAHDVRIGGGSIRCYAHDPGKHQDGIQAMGGQRVTFTGLDDQCLSANNSAMFINEGGNGLELPSDIVCISCYFAGAGYPVRIAVSLRSGIRNARICAGQFGSVRISPGVALSPVNVGTVIVAPGTGTCAGPTGPPTVGPKITSLTPAGAAGLASVTVTGTGLAGATQVAFNGDPSPQIVSSTATSVVAKVPVDATNGPLTVTTAAGTSAPSVAVFKPLAKISGFVGDPARVGDTVTVNGYDFTATGATPTVKLGSLALTPLGSLSATSFTVAVPDGALTGTLTVTNANGTASSPTPLHVKPTISGGPTPSHGPAGTVVTLTGNTFTGTTHVTIGGVTATLAIVDSHTLHVTVPAAALTGPVAVTNAGGTTSSSTVTVDPKITSFTPLAAAGLASVTVTGTGLAGATQVAFNGDPSPQIVSSTATSVVAKVPVDATNGPLTVTTAAGTSAPSVAVFKPLAKISGFVGDPAQVGDTVTVNGYDFTATGATPTVKLGTLALTPGSPSATSFTVTVPDGSLTGLLTVGNANGTTSATLHVKPTINAGPSPTHGPAGTVVTLTGAAFTGTSHVTVGGVTAPFAIVDYHDLHVAIPAAAVTGPIAVSNAGGTASSAAFTVDPKITSFTPTIAAAGLPVTITGSGFGLGAETRVVKVGSVTATNVTYVSPTSLKFVVPDGAPLSDKIHVQVNGGVIADSLTNLNVTATIVSFTPTHGPAGTPVTITGTGFTGATAVKFNGHPAASFHVDSTTQISATVPTGTTPGPITILRSAAPTTITSATNFANESSITLFSPTSAHAGDQVVITGTDLQTASLVTFAGTSATAAPLSASASSVSVDVPATAQDGSITVHTALGDALSADSFTILPTIDSFSPGQAGASQTVDIYGSGFFGTPTVEVKNSSVMWANVTVVSATHITASVPDGAGVGHLVVTTANGTAESSTDFTFLFTHSNGLGQNYYDANPLNTYNQTTASEAANAWDPSGTLTIGVTCSGEAALQMINAANTEVAVWVYGSGPLQGHVLLNTADTTPSCPLASDPSWN